ncbi:MAG: exodeoxyribonuclease V subunit alpha [Bacteroidota bacterium]
MVELKQSSRQFASFFKEDAIQAIALNLAEALSKGSICIPTASQNPEGLRTDWIANDLSLNRPFVVDGDNLYLYRYYQYQETILERIKTLVKKSQTSVPPRLNKLHQLPSLEDLKKQIDPNREVDWQTSAAILAYLNNFTIITGGPGTGKTTTIAKVLTLILSENKDAKIKMAAPTGKAAKRMEQALKENPHIPDSLRDRISGIKSSTIHRLLGTIHLSPYFKHNQEHPIIADVVIVDESSMIDVALFAKLLNAIGPDTRLILLGDQNQLASVEAGSLFGDICSSVRQQNAMPEELINSLRGILPSDQIANIQKSDATAGLLQSHLTSLKFSYRFKEEQKIGRLSKEVISGNWHGTQEILTDQSTPEELVFDPEYTPEIFSEFIEQYALFIQESNIKKALKKLEQIRVLSAVRMGKKGIYELNLQIEKQLYKKGLIKPSSEFYTNRPIIVTKNYHELNLFNGDIGIVRDGKVWFLDDTNEPRPVAPGLIAEVETVFAMTIHKSQGSEFDQVLMILPDQTDIEILTRELIYTGITRAKSRILIQSSLETLKAGVEKSVSRASGLQEKLLATSTI